MEIFGSDIDTETRTTKVGIGVRPFGDPKIDDDFEKVELAMDARDAHTYSAEWLPGQVRFFVDDALVKVVHQAPDYPMQFMVDIYDLAAEDRDVSAGAYPKVFDVEWVRSWRRAGPTD